jgi:ankyrin repeat protein
VVTALLKAGADIEARDKDGGTALMYAAEYNQNANVITALLKSGADLNAQDKEDKTALMRAARRNPNPEVIITLLNAGANGKARSNEGKRAFDYAQDNISLKGTDAYRQLQEASQ